MCIDWWFVGVVAIGYAPRSEMFKQREAGEDRGRQSPRTSRRHRRRGIRGKEDARLARSNADLRVPVPRPLPLRPASNFRDTPVRF